MSLAASVDNRRLSQICPQICFDPCFQSLNSILDLVAWNDDICIERCNIITVFQAPDVQKKTIFVFLASSNGYVATLYVTSVQLATGMMPLWWFYYKQQVCGYQLNHPVRGNGNVKYPLASTSCRFPPHPRLALAFPSQGIKRWRERVKEAKQVWTYEASAHELMQLSTEKQVEKGAFCDCPYFLLSWVSRLCSLWN